MTIADILGNILGISYATNEVQGSAGTYRMLSAITPPGFQATVANDPALNKKWLMVISADVKNPDLPDFDNLVLKAGDSVYLMYVRDVDHDKLSAREEALNGTSDSKPDTDDDGLGDFEEIRTGWTVHVEGHVPYTTHSRGFSPDFDGDTFTDLQEKNCGMDPVRADTDQDGISDTDEINGYDIVNTNGVTVLHIYPYAGAAILDGGNGISETTPAGDDVLTGDTSGPGAILVGPGPNGVIDTTTSGDDYVGVTHNALPSTCNGGAYATSPLSEDTDGDTVTDKSEKDIALGNPNNPDDFDKYIDTDGDGLSDAVETAGFKSLVNGAWKTFTSDKTAGDSDSDGLPDLLEYLLKSNPKALDTDGDGLSDIDEYDFVTGWADFDTRCKKAAGCSVPTTKGAQYGTSLTTSDTDGDGLRDKQEIDGWNVTVYNKAPYHVTSNAKNANTDTDGWNDYYEYLNKTDPHKADTDNDGTSDNVESTIWSDSWASVVTMGHRDPLTPDMRITVTYKKIDARSRRCNIFSNTLWYYFWLDLVVPDGKTVFMPRANDYCADRGCDHVAFQLYMPLDSIPEASFSFIMKKQGEEFTLKGRVDNIAIASAIACWFSGGNCSTATWNYQAKYTSAMMNTVSSTKEISGGGASCLRDDVITVQIDVD